MITWITLAAMLLVGLVATPLYIRWNRAKQEATYPKAWVRTGREPAGVDIALEVIKLMAPKEMRFGGYIEWVDGPFMCGYVQAAGCLIDRHTPVIKVMYFDLVEKTALAHEIGHYYGFIDGDPAFQQWIASVNTEIARRLGR
jgi:hypothetical protein